MQTQYTTLQQMYLSAVMACAESVKLHAMLHDLSKDGRQDAGMLYLCPPESTKPEATIMFRFHDTAADFAIVTRSQVKHSETVEYLEGIDGFLREMIKALRAGRLENKKAA